MDVELIVKVVIENNKYFLVKFISYMFWKIYFEREGKYFFDVFYVMNGGMMSCDYVNVIWLVFSGYVFIEIFVKFFLFLL